MLNWEIKFSVIIMSPLAFEVPILEAIGDRAGLAKRCGQSNF